MIGIFDSGVGGLTILKSINEKLPEYSTVYLGDNARAPYGELSREKITQYTWEGVRFLFEKGCSLVILACNTSSAQTLCTIQQEYLKDYPGKSVLGIIRPTVEAILEFEQKGGNSVAPGATELPRVESLGILATKATVDSKVYLDEFKDRNSELKIYEQACPGWVMLIENGGAKDQAFQIIASDVAKLMSRSVDIDAVLLACTHYPVFHNEVARALPAGVKIFDQGDLVAGKLVDYIKRHPEIDNELARSSKREFYTTGEVAHVSKIATSIAGYQIEFKHVDL